MSKGQHGNKEAKKPKQQPPKPLPPGAVTAPAAVAVRDQARRK